MMAPSQCSSNPHAQVHPGGGHAHITLLLASDHGKCVHLALFQRCQPESVFGAMHAESAGIEQSHRQDQLENMSVLTPTSEDSQANAPASPGPHGTKVWVILEQPSDKE